MLAASEPAGMVIDALPAVRAAAEEVKLPLLSVTDPVGVLPAPDTATVTCNDCTVVMPGAAGVTVTVGVVFCGGGGLTVLTPPPHAVIQRPAKMTRQVAPCLPFKLIAKPRLFP